MASELLKLQWEFTQCLANLYLYMRQNGYEAAGGECKRSDEQAVINSIGEHGRERVASLVQVEFPDLAMALRNNGKNNGVKLSVHQLKLAQDIDLFKGGSYLSDAESHRMFGEYWKKLHPAARWGGDFQSKDANHYSFEYNGVK